MMMSAIAPPIDAALLLRVEALQTTAEYITTLLEIVQNDLSRLVKAMREGPFASKPAAEFGLWGDWRTVETLLNLAQSQADIVLRTAQEVEQAGIDARRPTPGRGA